jgi:hypothetical protein
MEKHTIGHDPALGFDEARDYALDLLRDRGDLPSDSSWTAEDGTTDAHRDNIDHHCAEYVGEDGEIVVSHDGCTPAPEAVVVIRVYAPGEQERIAAEALIAATAAEAASDPVARYRAAVEAAGRALDEALNGPKLG